MKFTDQADINDYKKAISVGAMKGFGVGAVVSVGLAAVLKRRTSYFTNAGGLQKTLVWVAPSIFSGITFMEAASRSFEDHQRRKQHGLTDVAVQHKSASSFDAFTEFFGRNKYKFVTAGWAASMAGSFYIVNRDKYMTKAQKIVQARVYAQGLTVAMLLLTVFLSVGGNKSEADIEKEKKTIAAHSWERDIDFVKSANHPKGIPEDYEKKAAEKKPASTDEDKKTATDKTLQTKKSEPSSDAKTPNAPQDSAPQDTNTKAPPQDTTAPQDKQQSDSTAQDKKLEPIRN